MKIRIGLVLLVFFMVATLDHPLQPHQSATSVNADKEALLLFLLAKKAFLIWKKEIKYRFYPVPIFVLPLVLKAIQKKRNMEAEFYWVKPNIKAREFVRKYIIMNGGYQSLYY